MIKKEQMMNRHQIGYVYNELVDLWNDKLTKHINTIKESNKYKELYDAYGDTEQGKEKAKYRVDLIKETIDIANIVEKLIKINDQFYIGETGSYSTKAHIDHSAHLYLKDKVKYVKEFDESTKENLEYDSTYYALDKLKIHEEWRFKNKAHSEMKSRLALIPIGDHDDIIKNILNEVTVEKVIEFVNA